MTDIRELILYRNFENGKVLEDMTWIMEHFKEKECSEEVRGRKLPQMLWLWSVQYETRQKPYCEKQDACSTLPDAL